MNKATIIFILIAFIGLSGYISGFFYLTVHEQAHVAVFSKYGIDSKTLFQYSTLDGGTIPNEEQYIIKCNDQCKSDQLNIDAVGYHIALIIFSIHLLSMMLLIFYILCIRDSNKIQNQKV